MPYINNRAKYICSDCNIECESFNPRRCKDYKYRCINCRKIFSNKNQNNKKEYLKNYRLTTIYNITLNTFNKMLLEQNNLCKICNNNFKNDKDICVDHNHLTGKIRSLLCTACNLGLGKFKDNIEILRKAVIYLELHNV